MNIPSEDIKDFLEESSIGAGTFGATSNWGIYIADMPDSPDTIILLTDGVTDLPPEVNYDYEYPSVQIIIRGNQGGYLTAYAKAVEVRNGLHGITNETMNGTRYIQILCSSDIFFLGFDQNRRPQFSMNFSIQRTEV